jgi:hypothetical protein
MANQFDMIRYSIEPLATRLLLPDHYQFPPNVRYCVTGLKNNKYLAAAFIGL